MGYPWRCFYCCILACLVSIAEAGDDRYQLTMLTLGQINPSLWLSLGFNLDNEVLEFIPLNEDEVDELLRRIITEVQGSLPASTQLQPSGRSIASRLG